MSLTFGAEKVPSMGSYAYNVDAFDFVNAF